jgi:hypothetical protein
MGPEQSRSKMVSLQDFDLIRVGLGLGKGKLHVINIAIVETRK